MQIVSRLTTTRERGHILSHPLAHKIARIAQSEARRSRVPIDWHLGTIAFECFKNVQDQELWRMMQFDSQFHARAQSEVNWSKFWLSEPPPSGLQRLAFYRVCYAIQQYFVSIDLA